jgi:hypothetical protein
MCWLIKPCAGLNQIINELPFCSIRLRRPFSLILRQGLFIPLFPGKKWSKKQLSQRPELLKAKDFKRKIL